MNEVKSKRRKHVNKFNEDKRNLQQQWTDLQEQLKLIEEEKNAITAERQKLDAQKQHLAAAQYQHLKNVTQEATPVVVKSVSNIGNLREFTLNDNWILWMEKFECYLIVNEVAEEKKVPLFMTVLNMEAHALLHNLCAPSLPHTKCLGDLKKVMTNYLNPIPSVIAARCSFKECRQKEGEEIKEFVAKLKAISLRCNFGVTLENELRDQFVSGIKSDFLKKMLMKENNLTFRFATALATALQPDELKKEMIAQMNINRKKCPLDTESPKSDEGLFCDGRRNIKEQFVALIYWRDPVNSFSVFFAIFVVLHAMAYFNLIFMLGQSSLLMLGVSVIFRIFEIFLKVVRVTSNLNPLKHLFDACPTLTAKEVHEFVDVILSYSKTAVAEFRRLFLVENFMNSLRFGIILFSLTVLGSWFNGLTLIIICVFALFTLPKFYETKKT